MSHKKKIAYVTGTRADFGLMTPVLRAVQKSAKLSLSVYATGMHLMPQFSRTITVVRKSFPDVKAIKAILQENTPAGTALFLAGALAGVTKAFSKNRPNLVLLWGDRPEMLATAAACLYLKIPTAHLHGGERSGTGDEVARHAIAKLSSLHFTATRDAADRVRKMGEDAWRIHVVGAPALDTILRAALPSKRAVSAFASVPREGKFVLLVQHPGEAYASAGSEMEETIAALKKLALPVVAVYPNADAGSERIIRILESKRRNPLFRIFKNIPHEMFLALERDAAVWIGNSSAALIEGASWRTPVVNIGERQKGRLRGKHVIDVRSARADIAAAVEKALYNRRFRKALRTTDNPWGDGKTGPRVAKLLEQLTIDDHLLNKQISY